MRKALLALCLLATPALAATSVHVRAHLTNADGDEVGTYRYTPVAFDSVKACEEFLNKGGDERFQAGTEQLKTAAADQQLTVTLTCDEDPEAE